MSAENGAGQGVDLTPLSRRNPVGLAEHFWKSGYFTDVESLSQAVVKIAAGEELGFGPMTSMQGIHIIKSKPSLSANLLAVKVKQSARYNFRPVEADDTHAKIEWFEDGVSVGFSEYTIEQAKKAGLVRSDSGWARTPEDMLFARALTRGIRRYCPDVTAGAPAYTPEELGAEVDAQGEPVYVESTVEPDATAVAADPLDPERIEHLLEGIEILKPNFSETGVTWVDGLNLLLGSIGINALSPTEELEEGLSKLSEEEADSLDREMQVMLDEEIVDGEVVAEGSDS